MHSLVRRLAPAGLAWVLSSILLFPALAGPSQQGAEFTVNSELDEVDALPGDSFCLSSPSGLCTLRAAIMEANALAGDDGIVLPPGLYLLTIEGAMEDGAATGDLDIRENLTISGSGMDKGGADGTYLNDRAVHVFPGVVLNLSGVSFWYSNAGPAADGGGLLNEGSVAMVETSFQFNQARSGAGVLNLGDMALLRSVIGYNTAAESGAGVRNEGTLTIDSSTIANNEVTGGTGGGIENYGTLVIRNSTISQNRATSRAAAIDNRAGASAVLNNTTVYANFTYAAGPGATGGILADDPDSVRLGNTILAINATNSGDTDCLGTILSAGYNLIGDLADCSLSGDVAGNLIGLDPRLPMLPTVDPAMTWGYPPDPGSPAIDAGNPADPGSSETACEVADQRGYARPIGSVCDMGAYESEFGTGGTPTQPPTIEIPTFTPTWTTTFTPTFTWTPTITSTLTVTRTGTVATPTRSLTPSRTLTPTATRTRTPSRTPTPTETPTPTITPTTTLSPTNTATSAPSPLFADSFESGDLSAWSSAQTDSGDLSVTTDAAMGGSYGLQAVLDDHRSIYVVDDTPAAETAYQVRFYLDPNGLSMIGSNPHVLLLALDASGSDVFRAELRSHRGDYQVRAVVLRDHGQVATPWTTLTDAPHFLEIGWRAASSMAIHDGALRWWIDGDLKGKKTNLDNDSRRIDSVRWGAVRGVGATRGTFYLDAFVSTRGIPIGPELP